jgi:hypothetical protein
MGKKILDNFAGTFLRISALSALLLTIGLPVSQVVLAEGWPTALKRNTAWIMLGIVSDDGKWQTEPAFKNITLESFGTAHAAIGLGNQLRLNVPHTAYVVGYAQSGDRVYEIPASNGIVDKADQTPWELPAGIILKVQAVAKGPTRATDKWVVWARVTPVEMPKPTK